MKILIAIALSLTLPFLGLSGVASAQSAVEVHGGIVAVDCQTETVVVNTVDGQRTFLAAGNAYAEVDSTDLPFCSLEGYVGAPATVWVVASGDRFVVTAVDVIGPVAVAPVTAEVVAPLPIWGVVLGTVVVTGLLYLVVHGPDNGYYRYPYYGAYYRHYYHPWYRHYAGFYPASAPIITVALPVVGVVLGTVTVGGDLFLVSRDPVGDYYRYPYYGPYHQYYYRPAYRPYHPTTVQAYEHAAVRQGDPQWDAPARVMGPVYRAGRNAPSHQAQPAFHQPNNPTPHQAQPAFHQPNNPTPHQPQPAFHQPNNPTPHQPQPAFHQPNNPTPHQPQPAFHQPNNPTPHQPQPAFRQPNNPTPHQPQPAFHQPNNPTPHQTQPAFRQPNNPTPHQPQPAFRQPNNPTPQQPQPAYRQAGGNSDRSQPASRRPGSNSPAQQGSAQSCGGHQSHQSDQSCSNRGK